MSEEIKNQQAAEPEALTETEINEQMQVRINKMHQIEEKGWKPFGHKFEWTHHAQDVADQFEELAARETVVRLSGRVMAIRGHGKTCFIDLMDKTGRIQLYVRKDALGEENYTLIKLMDIGDIIGSYENLTKYKEQIDLFNGTMSGVEAGSVYAIPCNMNSNGPTAFVGTEVLSAPRVPWDLYEGLGCPELKTTDDLLNMLADMQEKYPTNAAGDKAFAITMWKDWDGGSIENANLLTNWFGQQVKESVLLGNDNTIMPLTDKNGGYYKALQFFYKANQMGLVDPDSATQDWTTACDSKMKQKRVYLFWYNWQNGFWNTPEHGQNRENYMYTPVADLNFFQTADSYYGDGRVWGVGSQVDEEKKLRIMELLDWLASPEGLTYQHNSLEGFIYTVNDDGTYTLTKEGQDRFTGDLQVPEEMGGGTWSDGNNQINQWIAGSAELNPVTGEYFEPNLWSSTIEMNQTATTKEWSEKFGAVNEVEYMKNKGQLGMVANVNIPLASDDTDTALIRSQCKSVVCDASWRMVFATSDEEFEKMWDDMCVQLEGFGWNDLVAFDTDKYQAVIDARKAAE